MTINNFFDKEGPIFMGSQKNIDNCSVGIFGANYDGTTSFKPGARFGPDAIRVASQCLETYCPVLDSDLNEIKYYDYGSIPQDFSENGSLIKKVKLGVQYILKDSLNPLLLGGEHSITSGAIEALVNKYPDLILIQLDAHADFRDTYQNSKFSHACTMRRCIEILPSKNIFQIGIRSGTKEEFKMMQKHNQLIQFQTNQKNNHLKELFEEHKNTPLYLTLDLDWFDPSLISGTGTPEPGGFFWSDFENILSIINSLNLVGADIVELSPELDPSGVSSIVAAKAARSLIMTLDKTHRKELSL